MRKRRVVIAEKNSQPIHYSRLLSPYCATVVKTRQAILLNDQQNGKAKRTTPKFPALFVYRLSSGRHWPDTPNVWQNYAGQKMHCTLLATTTLPLHPSPKPRNVQVRSNTTILLYLKLNPDEFLKLILSLKYISRSL